MYTSLSICIYNVTAAELSLLLCFCRTSTQSQVAVAPTTQARDPRLMSRDPRNRNANTTTSMLSPSTRTSKRVESSEERSELGRTSIYSSAITSSSVASTNMTHGRLESGGDVDLRSFHSRQPQPNTGFESRTDVDLRQNMLVGASSYNYGDTDLRGGGGDVDLRGMLGLPFKPVPMHTPATEIDASLTSHPPIPYKVVTIAIPRPDYSGLKLNTSDPQVRKILCGYWHHSNLFSKWKSHSWTCIGQSLFVSKPNVWICVFYRFGMIHDYVSSSRFPAMLWTVLPPHPPHYLPLSRHHLLLQEMTLGDATFQRHPILLQSPVSMNRRQYILRWYHKTPWACCMALACQPILFHPCQQYFHMIQDIPGTQEMHLEFLVLLHYHPTIAQILQDLRTLKRATAMVLTQITGCSMGTMLPCGNSSCHSHKISICTGTEIGGTAEEISIGSGLSNRSRNGLLHHLCEEE